ncbi:hypothetical protein J6590_060363 [Homalodisca vitripennis]|nr:hypothetical protein J6590_060363 [Homalodisca vitripennis]
MRCCHSSFTTRDESVQEVTRQRTNNARLTINDIRHTDADEAYFTLWRGFYGKVLTFSQSDMYCNMAAVYVDFQHCKLVLYSPQLSMNPTHPTTAAAVYVRAAGNRQQDDVDQRWQLTVADTDTVTRNTNKRIFADPKRMWKKRSADGVNNGDNNQLIARSSDNGTLLPEGGHACSGRHARSVLEPRPKAITALRETRLICRYWIRSPPRRASVKTGWPTAFNDQRGGQKTRSVIERSRQEGTVAKETQQSVRQVDVLAGRAVRTPGESSAVDSTSDKLCEFVPQPRVTTVSITNINVHTLALSPLTKYTQARHDNSIRSSKPLPHSKALKPRVFTSVKAAPVYMTGRGWLNLNRRPG